MLFLHLEQADTGRDTRNNGLSEKLERGIVEDRKQRALRFYIGWDNLHKFLHVLHHKTPLAARYPDTATVGTLGSTEYEFNVCGYQNMLEEQLLLRQEDP
jgi:hypothetical protein